MPQKLKRILTDAGGYGLILLGAATGWLPGPGGIPLVLAGLGLLSINNAWARRLRDWVIKQGGDAVQKLFPQHPWVQAGYDVLVLVLLGVVAWLGFRHAAIWQISLAVALFCIAVVIATMNRDRGPRIKRKLTK